jgi:single-stranded-DNA-specific exonuclease
MSGTIDITSTFHGTGRLESLPWRFLHGTHDFHRLYADRRNLPYEVDNALFFTKVAGVTFEGRQPIVARCSVGESLVLVRDPNNHFDKGAIKVVRLNGEQVGFIPAHVSRSGDSSGLAFRMDQGSEYRCRITNITGGGPGESLGVNIEITEGEFDESAQVNGSKAAPTTTADARVLLSILAVIIIGCILWAVFK